MTHIDIDIQDEQEVARVLALLNREQIPYRVGYTRTVTPEERERAREIVMQGAPSLDVEEMLEWLKESRKDRKLPFRDEE